MKKFDEYLPRDTFGLVSGLRFAGLVPGLRFAIAKGAAFIPKEECREPEMTIDILSACYKYTYKYTYTYKDRHKDRHSGAADILPTGALGLLGLGSGLGFAVGSVFPRKEWRAAAMTIDILSAYK